MPSGDSVGKMEVKWSTPDFGEDERETVLRVLDSGWVTMGKETEQLEHELAPVTGYKHNIVVNSGTSALTAALLALKAYNEGYTVRIPSYTFKATENAVYASGVRDVKYGDVDHKTGLMKYEGKEKQYEIQLPVHFAGIPLDQQVWGEVPYVVEDAAESLGARTRNTGDMHSSRLVCYSMHAAKLITMIEGGCVSTNSDEYAYRLRAIRRHGESPDEKGVFIERGFNFKPLDICSAVGRVQLKKLKQYLDNRLGIAKIYRDELCGIVGFQDIPEYVSRHANMMFPIYTSEPRRLAEKLREQGIETRLGWKPLKLTPGAIAMSSKTLCIPIYNTMGIDEAVYVVDKIKEAMR